MCPDCFSEWGINRWLYKLWNQRVCKCYRKTNRELEDSSETEQEWGDPEQEWGDTEQEWGHTGQEWGHTEQNIVLNSLSMCHFLTGRSIYFYVCAQIEEYLMM